MDVLFGDGRGVSLLRKRVTRGRWIVSTVVALAVAGPAVAAMDQKKNEAERSADTSDKVICKRFAETGSLVSSHRVCKTKREWDQERDEIRASVRASGACNTGNGPCF